MGGLPIAHGVVKPLVRELLERAVQQVPDALEPGWRGHAGDLKNTQQVLCAASDPGEQYEPTPGR